MKKFILCFFISTVSVLLFAQKPIKVACVGNSITYGLKLDNPEVESYPAQLQKLLGKDYLVGNFGKSGATLLSKGHHPYIKEKEYQGALDFRGDIVVIHLGINDTDPRNWPNYRDDFVSDYLQLINNLKKANPKARFIIARLSPISSRHKRFLSGTRDWLGQIQEHIETVAKISNSDLIDFHEPLYKYPNFFPDGLHPNKEGAYILAKCVYSAITGDYGGLQLPIIYTDNMVLQRNQELTISGIANAGEEVTVSIGKQVTTCKTGIDGHWTAYLQPLSAGGPYTMTFSTPGKTICCKNVMIGEVWLCSGQSNMEFMMWQSDTGSKDVQSSKDNDLRLFNMKGYWRPSQVQWNTDVLDSINHLHFYKTTQWQPTNPETVNNFSAIAYYFGKALRDSLKVPIGLICNAIGGSPTEAWIDRASLEYQFPAILNDWTHNDFVQDWVRERAIYNTTNTKDPLQRHPYEPCFLYETGIAPLAKYPIKGVLWYQGESNAHNYEAHEKLFSLLVDGWRKQWEKKQLPFYFVQLSSMNRPSWTWFRDSQRRLAECIPNVRMVVSSDKGDSTNVHPQHKLEIGERLSKQVLRNEYGYNIVSSGPVVKYIKTYDGYVEVYFDCGHDLHAADGNHIIGFEIAEEEGMFYKADVEVHDGYLKLWNDNVKNPHLVRYGWQPFTRANLVNGADLPASTFRMKEK